MQRARHFIQEDQAATGTEYGIILGLAALVALVGIYFYYDQLADLFSRWVSEADSKALEENYPLRPPGSS
jgi:Flp pilus assembly pilin Flp